MSTVHEVCLNLILSKEILQSRNEEKEVKSKKQWQKSSKNKTQNRSNTVTNSKTLKMAHITKILKKKKKG